MRIDQIEKRAYKLLDDLQIRNAPIPVDEIASKLGIQIIYEPFDGDLSGVLYREEKEVIIGVNALHPSNRKRFTVAHEIGHFLLHEGNEMHIDRNFRINFRDNSSSTATNREEVEANAFAAALLMPEHLVMKSVLEKVADGKDILHDEAIIDELANYFKVSKQSLLIRLGKMIS